MKHRTAKVIVGRVLYVILCAAGVIGTWTASGILDGWAAPLLIAWFIIVSITLRSIFDREEK